MELCTRLAGWEKNKGSFLLRTDTADILLVFLTDEIIRLRVSFDRTFAEESYVLMTTAWEDRLDPLFTHERKRLAPLMPQPEETAESLSFETASVRLEIGKNPLCVSLFDREGSLLYRSLPGLSFTLDSNRRVTHYSCMEEEDCFYGFGEQTGPLNKNKACLREKAADAMGYDPQKTDTLYKHIPFYTQLNRQSGKAVGLFYHNFYESVFNMGREKSNYYPRYSFWRADGGDVDLFLLGGNSLKRIVDHYTLLTGRPALLPKRALGYQASSMYYPELEKDCDEAILHFADTAAEEGFPLDGFHLSSGYTEAGGKRAVFTWNRERFPEPAAFFRAMKEKGAQVVPNVKPGILLEHPRLSEFLEEDVLIRDSRDPEKPALGSWWGGPGVFWDFTSPAGRVAWKRHLTEDVLRIGTDSVWNDNCEYDSLPDLDARADFDGKGGTVGQLRPLMSTLMCRTGAEAIRENSPNTRPYVVCRSGSAGIQKYAQTWCGDNRSDWESLRWSIPILLGMGLSGQPNEGADVGGFAGPAPDEELFVRWVQNGIFQPRFSIHSASDDNTVTEPWMYSGSTELVRDAMRLRCRLIPYLYSAAYEAHMTGAPIMRPTVFEFQEDPLARDENFDFLFGRDLLIAGVLEPGAKSRRVYLPKGCRWYDWNDRFREYEGGQTVELPVTPATIPMFLRGSGIVPMADNPIQSMERDRVTALHLLVAPGEDREYLYYDDDGVTDDWEKGVCRRVSIRMYGDAVVSMDFHAEGSWPDSVEQITVEMIRKDRAPLQVCLGENALPHFLNRRQFEEKGFGWYYSMTERAVLIRYPNPKKDCSLQVSFERRDLIGMQEEQKTR